MLENHGPKEAYTSPKSYSSLGRIERIVSIFNTPTHFTGSSHIFMIRKRVTRRLSKQRSGRVLGSARNSETKSQRSITKPSKSRKGDLE